MQITSIDWYLVNQFVHEDMVNSPEYRPEEQKWDEIPKVVFVVHTSDGHFGLGETPRGVTPEAFQQEAQALIHCNPLQLDLTRLPLERKSGGIYQGIEVALFDLVGRIQGKPVCELLGGRRVSHVRGSYWASRQTPEHSRRTAMDAVRHGYTCLKIKAKKGDPLVERIRAMHEVAPELSVIIDPMQRYDDVDEMIEISRALEPYNVLCLEDPLPKDRLDWYQRLKQEAPTPLALHVGSVEQMKRAIEAGCIDIFNCTPSSMLTFVEMAGVAESAGAPCWHGSGADLGILDASYIHAAAAAANCRVPSDILSTVLHVDDFVVDAPSREGDRIEVPQDPGLGCTLDMDAVQKYLIEKGRVS